MAGKYYYHYDHYQHAGHAAQCNPDFNDRDVNGRKILLLLWFVSSSWDKLTLATEEGTKLVCSSLFFLAFYKDRYKNRHGKMRRLFTWELSVRVCQDEWVRVCVLQDKRGEKLLLVRPRTTYWASRTSSERARTREASRTWQRNHQGRSAGKQSIPCEVGPDNHWEDKLEPKPIRQHVKKDRGNVLNTCRELGQTRDKGSC